MRLKIQDLIPGTDYVLQVRAIVDGEKSRWSEKFEFTTTSNDSAPAIVQDVTFDCVGDTFVSTWSPVTKNIAAESVKIVSYELEYTADAVTKIVSVVAKTDSTNSYTLTKNHNTALFGTAAPSLTFRIRAVSNKNIKGDWSEPLFAGNPPPAAPGNFEAVPGMMSIQLTWDAVEEDDIAGYSVWVGDHDGFEATAANLVYTGDATTFLYISSTFVEQFFILRAFDTFGQYSEDATASATPLDPFHVDITPPDLPVITIGSLSNNSNGIGAVLYVAWTQTIPDDDDLAGFWLRYRKVGTSDWEIAPYQAEDRAASLEVLYAYSDYEVQLRSVDTFANASGWTDIYTVTSPANTPPSNVTGLVSTAGKDSITYQWSAVSDTDIKNYELTLSTSPTFASGNITYLTGSATVLTVGGLTYGTTYYARVRAVDQGGLSSPSWSVTDTETTGVAPAPTDGYAPASSPTPNVVGRLNSLYVTWPSVTTNSNGDTQNDAVTYDVHLSTTSGFTPSGATKVTEVTATSTMISNLPGTTTALSYGTTYYVKLVARDRDGSAAAGAQGSGTLSKVASSDVTSIGADLIVPGSGFIANLVINTGGSIQSSNWSSGAAGWKISPTGAEFNDSGSAIKVDALRAGTIGGSSGAGVINVAAGTSLIFNGGYLKSNTNTGTTMSSAVTSGAGFYLGNDGLFIGGGANGGQIKANALISDTLTSTTITLGAGGSIVGGSWSLSSSGLSIPNGAIQASMINITSAFGNSVTGASTTIDGGKINTGTIVSTANAVNIITGAALSPAQPAWSISTSGAAQFGNVSVLGRINVGSSSYGTSSGIQSYNYIAGSQGWKIDGSGNAFFANGTFIGTVKSSTSNSDYISLNSSFNRIDFVDNGISTGYIGSKSYSGQMFVSITSGSTGIIVNSSSGIGLQGNTNITGSTTISGALSVTNTCTFSNDVNVGKLVGNTWATGLFRSEQNITTNYNGSTAGGFFDLVQTSAAACYWNNSGRVWVQGSSRRFKKNISAMTIDEAKVVLDIEPVRFKYRAESDMGDAWWPGFIAEQADEVGANMWVNYESDGVTPFGFKYAEMTPAHNLLIKNLYSENEALREDNNTLKSQVNSLEERMNALEVRLAN
jgi:hypothetical protein